MRFSAIFQLALLAAPTTVLAVPAPADVDILAANAYRAYLSCVDGCNSFQGQKGVTAATIQNCLSRCQRQYDETRSRSISPSRASSSRSSRHRSGGRRSGGRRSGGRSRRSVDVDIAAAPADEE